MQVGVGEFKKSRTSMKLRIPRKVKMESSDSETEQMSAAASVGQQDENSKNSAVSSISLLLRLIAILVQE